MAGPVTVVCRTPCASGMDGGPYCYTYDGNGMRVKKANASGGACTGSPTVDALYWRNIAGNTIAETGPDGGTSNASYHEYVFFAGRRVARSDPASGIQYYYFVDQIGSTRSVAEVTPTNSPADGTVCFNADYYPYGQEIDFTTTCPQSYKFTGYERDAETGLDYAFARYYNDRMGRFMSGDPLGGDSSDPQTLNRYAYVRNSPVNLVDPTGGESSGGGPNPFENIEPCFTGCDIHGFSGGAHSIVDDFEACVKDLRGQGYSRSQAEARCGPVIGEPLPPPEVSSPPPPSTPAPSSPPQKDCKPAVSGAIDQQFGPGPYTMSDPFPNGGATNFNVYATGLAAGQFNSIQPGRYPLHWWSYVVGYGPTLHVTGQTLLNQGAVFTNSNIGGVTSVQFTAHIDSAFPYNPFGAVIHLFKDLLHLGGPRDLCP